MSNPILIGDSSPVGLKPEVIDSASARKTEVFPGIWLQILLPGEKVMMTVVTARKGAVLPEHSHPHEQTGYVVKGSLELIVEGEKLILREGSNYIVPGGMRHSVLALEDFTVVDAFSPPREDYLKYR
jgi:quercetin dioxygenase-like cupin family protein